MFLSGVRSFDQAQWVMMMITGEDVLSALRAVQDPELGRDLVSLNMVTGVEIRDDTVRVTVNLTTPACPLQTDIEQQCRQVLLSLPGVKQAEVRFTATVTGPTFPNRQTLLPDVKNILAVGSVKGGVGKTTVAVNLAVALGMAGAKVGLLDADLFGPDVPIMMGDRSAPKAAENRLTPLERHGVRFISLGSLIPEEAPVLWRGPMVHTTLRQLFRDVTWGPLDYLVVDLPPGTGDASLSLIELVPLAGVVLVTTPQRASVNVVVKALSMFKNAGVPILGIVENMSYFICPRCGTRTDIFAHGGGKQAAVNLGIPFLGDIPLDIRLRIGGDWGEPIVINEPASPMAAAFRAMAAKVAARISVLNAQMALADSDRLGDA
jgi:ATP-binding protein involved in chromosome partitioning